MRSVRFRLFFLLLLAGDIRRADSLLVLAWLTYMRHLKGSSPYLFSLAVRTNPLDTAASALIRS